MRRPGRARKRPEPRDAGEVLRRLDAAVLRQRQAIELLRGGRLVLRRPVLPVRRLVLRRPLLPAGQAVPVGHVPLPAREDDLRARVLHIHGEVLRRPLLSQGEDLLRRAVL
jgi:hypothetical protein